MSKFVLTPEECCYVLVGLAATWIRQERFSEVLALLRASIRIKSDYPTAYDLLGSYYIEQDIYPEQALEAFELCLTYSPRPESNSFLGITHWCGTKAREAVAFAVTGNIVEASAAIESALFASDSKFFPGHAGLHVLAGSTYRNLTEAEKFYRKAIELDPNGDAGHTAVKMLNKLNLSTLLLFQRTRHFSHFIT